MARALALVGLLAGPLCAQQATPPAQRAEITSAELARRRDLWPQAVALTKDARLSGAPALRAGTVLRLQDWSGANVVLDGGQFLFDFPLENTDLLARARSAIAALTSEQLALTADELRKRTELWPLRVALSGSMGFDNGQVIPAGREVSLRGFEGASLSLYDRESAAHFQVETYETDLFVRARARMLFPREDPFFVRALEATLMPVPGANTTRALDGAEFILVFGGRLGCSRCEAFEPKLTKFYEQNQAKLGGFELVFFSADRSPAEARAHLEAVKLPGRVVAYERRLEAANLASIESHLLPNLFLLDRAGNLLFRNDPNGGSPSASDVLADLEKRLRARAAK